MDEQALTERDDRRTRILGALAEGRRRRQLSQTEVAARMGTSQPTLARLEAGDGDPRLSTIERYASAIDIKFETRFRMPGAATTAPAFMVHATDLQEWSGRLSSQADLPELVRRLIRATTSGVSRLDFPSAEGIQQQGWDGIATVAIGNEFVPEGTSLWELGTSADARRKADDDFAKRSADPCGQDPATSTFVFVSLVRWRGRGGKGAWEASKRKGGPWPAVRVIDADGLFAWLQLAPPVHHWISERVGKRPTGARSLDDWWATWSHATDPFIPPELITAGRWKEVERVAEHLAGPPGVLAVRADTQDEAAAFILAVIEQLPNGERGAVHACGLLIEDEAAWRHAVATDGELVLVPTFTAEITAEAAHRHHILVPLGRDGATRGEAVELGRLARDEAEGVILGMLRSSRGIANVEKERDLGREARSLSTVTRNSLSAFRRRFAISPVLRQPAWAVPAERHALVPALLLGGWEESKQGDREVVGNLSGSPYDEYANELQRLAAEQDPPIRRTGRSWYLVDREDSWALVAEGITTVDLERFERVVLSVLGTHLPAMDLPPEDQWKASILGSESPQSEKLREGLAETLALVASRTGEAWVGRIRGKEFAQGVVANVLRIANDDITGRTWASISGQLPNLAEAAPDVFLDEVERGMNGDAPVTSLFMDFPGRDPMFSSSPHTGLLWALEALAWSREYLARVTLVLGRLASIDPGGRLSNRPAHTLREIFLPWHPSTNASFDERMEALDALDRNEAAVCWALTVALLPKKHDTAMPTYEPRWRDWGPQGREAPSIAQYVEWARELTDRLLVRVGVDPARWKDLVDAVDGLPPDARTKVLDGLLALDPSGFDSDGRLLLTGAIRETVGHHRRYPEAKWAMPSADIDRLAEALAVLEPEDLVDKHQWLFAAFPKSAEFDDDDEGPRRGEASVERAREGAVRDVLGQLGLAGILRIASSREHADQVGRALGRHGIGNEDELLALLGVEQELPRLVGASYAVGRFLAEGIPWAKAVMEQRQASWEPEVSGHFLVALPPGRWAWDWVEKLGLDSLYWPQALAMWMDSDEDHEYAARKLIEAGRPRTAVDVLSFALHRAKSPSPELVADALEAAASGGDQDVDGGTLQYAVERLLDFLDETVLATDRVARIEFMYLRLTSHVRPPRALGRLLARDPVFFADVVATVFRAEGAEPSAEVSESARLRAELAYELLSEWKDVPGVDDAGTIDAERLHEWVLGARAECASRGRGAIGDQQVGRILRHATPAIDGVWPPVPVADLIEELSSREIERGLEIEVYNTRGVTSRALTEGGRQERQLARQFREWAQRHKARSPRTRSLLLRIATSFDSDADREDLESQLREDQGW